MRSHTGDRPYKCQHCGDQFARSDLLSRHVNKCHAGDKPPTTTAPTRRKGAHGASSTRATTSKQACDQCVMATRPCDGANPCSKCLQLKSACTYVKFQRQTAPSGPGHKHSHSVDSAASSSSLASSMPRPDELFMGPPPMTVPSMGTGGDLFYANVQSIIHPNAQFAFNPPPDSGPDSSPDLAAARYRAMNQTGFGYLNPSDYYTLQQQQQLQGNWNVPLALQQHNQRKVDESFSQYLPTSATASHQIGGPSALLNPTNLDFHGHGSSSSGGFYSLQQRRGSVDGFSDTSGASAPNSANSSSVHLPLDFSSSTSSSDQQQPQQPPFNALYSQFDGEGQRMMPPSREGRVASSFGMMSLADMDGDQPFIADFNTGTSGMNLGMNMEGNAPFFTQHAMKLPPSDSTPRPFRNGESSYNAFSGANNGIQPSLSSSSTGAGASGTSENDRDAELRELREFWKQYLRTPLTGPMLGSNFGMTPKAELINNQLGALGEAMRPTPKRGLSRVASLPSVRTPSDEKSVSRVGSNNTNHGFGNNGHSQSFAQLAVPDDLKSYEQAVLARKPLNNLNLVPRKGRTSVSSSASPQPQLGSQYAHIFTDPGAMSIFSGLDGSGSSSDDNPPNGSSSTSTSRPSFKRLASQTLENATQKRAFFRWGSEEAVEDTDSEADLPSEEASTASLSTSASPAMDFVDGQAGNTSKGFRDGNENHASYHRGMQVLHSEPLMDRYRRQSAPSAARPSVGELDMSELHLHSHQDQNASPASYTASPLQPNHPKGVVVAPPISINNNISAPQPGVPSVDSNTLLRS